MRFFWQRVRPKDHAPRRAAGSRAKRSRDRGRPWLVEALEPRQLLSGLTLTAAGQADGFGLETFATGFPQAPGTTIGPLGVGFPASGGVLVSDATSHVRLFPNDNNGQVANAVSPASVPGGAGDIIREGDTLYIGMGGQIAQISANGVVQKVVARGFQPYGIVLDPFNGHFFASGNASTIFDVDPSSGAVKPFAKVDTDGLALDVSRGILYGACDSAAEGLCVKGFDIATGALVFKSQEIADGPDGIAVGVGPVAGNLFVNSNGGRVVEINQTTGAETVIATGGSRGDFVTVDPNDGTLLLTQTDRIMRLVPGVFEVPADQLTTTTRLSVTPTTSTFGQAVTLTAAVSSFGPGIPSGTVTFVIDGQRQTPVSVINVGGLDQATMTMSSLGPGTLSITATYSGDSTFAPSDSHPVTETINALPMITGEQVLTTRKMNKTGKPVAVGFALDYSTAMDAASAGLAANYQVTYTTTQHGGKRHANAGRPVVVQSSYDASRNVVTLMIVGKQGFAKGGRIIVNAAPPSGVSSMTGVFLASNDTAFTILTRAKAIWPSAQVASAKALATVTRSKE